MLSNLTPQSLFALGDVFAQITVPPSNKDASSGYDYARTLRALIYGGVVFAPIGTRWYPILEKVRLPGSKPPVAGKRDIPNTVYRVAVDQLLFSPAAITLYFTVMGLMQQKTPAEIKKGWKDNFASTVLANWTVWPTFQLVNFSVVPVGYRLLAVNVVSLGWNTFLSHKYSKTNLVKGTEGHPESTMDGDMDE